MTKAIRIGFLDFAVGFIFTALLGQLLRKLAVSFSAMGWFMEMFYPVSALLVTAAIVAVQVVFFATCLTAVWPKTRYIVETVALGTVLRCLVIWESLANGVIPMIEYNYAWFPYAIFITFTLIELTYFVWRSRSRQ